jgi:flagellar basal body-associated protein FliL
MADTDTDTVTETVEKKGRSKLLLIGGAVGLLLVLGAVYMFVLAPGDDPEAAAAAAAEEAAAAAADGDIVEVANFTASLQGPDPHFAKLGFSAVLSTTALADDVTARFPLLQDAALMVLARTSADDLRTAAGGEQLRADLTAEAQQIWPDGEILRIVLTELVVQ